MKMDKNNDTGERKIYIFFFLSLTDFAKFVEHFNPFKYGIQSTLQGMEGGLISPP